MNLSRRSFVASVSFFSVNMKMGAVASAGDAPVQISVAARSPWLANQVALTRDGTMFLGLPRHAVSESTPSLGRVNTDGKVSSFPGNTWNKWKPGDDGREAFVYLNSVHIFADDTVWCLDQGSVGKDTPKPGAQKLVQLDAKDGRILNVIRFGDDILPPGAKLNDLRFHGSTMYLSESGLGALIVHDMTTGETMRRLSERPQLVANPKTVTLKFGPGDKETTFSPPNADMLEISADGKWLYWAAPTGPLYRIATQSLRDPAVSDAALVGKIEHVADIQFSGGSSMDTLGNFYFSETNTRRITVLSPSGKWTTLALDPRLIRPDGSFIGADRRLYIPIKNKQSDLPPETPYPIFTINLPNSFGGFPLGAAVTGG